MKLEFGLLFGFSLGFILVGINERYSTNKLRGNIVQPPRYALVVVNKEREEMLPVEYDASKNRFKFPKKKNPRLDSTWGEIYAMSQGRGYRFAAR